MIILEYVTQPENEIDYLQLFRRALEEAEFDRIHAAVAYATMGGVSAITSVFEEEQAQQWQRMKKQWLVSIDWCRTEPLALDALTALANSTVKVPDGVAIVRRRGCTPMLPFHPKVFRLEGPGAVAVVSGSGNLSRNGLTRGHECGSLLLLKEPLSPDEEQIRKGVDAVAALVSAPVEDRNSGDEDPGRLSGSLQRRRAIPQSRADR